MYKSITILYIVCFGLYILFTRQPDFFDGEMVPANIHFSKDSSTGLPMPKAVFHAALSTYAIDARYVLRSWEEGEKLTVIYETDHPEKGAVYLFWGYWLSWGELMATVLIYLALFKIATAVTQNPTPEALLEQLTHKEKPKKKYKE